MLQTFQSYTVDLEDSVMEKAKRLFPGMPIEAVIEKAVKVTVGNAEVAEFARQRQETLQARLQEEIAARAVEVNKELNLK